MQLDIRHITRYSYARPVSLGPHIVRLHPRTDANLLSLDYSCQITPAPCVKQECLDPAGNVILRAEFDTPTRELVIDSRIRATKAATVGEFAARSTDLPVQYSDDEAALLAAYTAAPALDAASQALLESLRTASQGHALEFLDLLNAYIHEHIEREIRDLGTPQTPEQTLARRRGACRDVTVLFMALCRTLGFAARFVSGYQDKSAIDHGQRYLHAWPEVYVPGLAWRGYDPTRGIRVADGHVAICAARAPAGAAPIEGSYFGEAVDNELTFEVYIDAR